MKLCKKGKHLKIARLSWIGDFLNPGLLVDMIHTLEFGCQNLSLL